jgi:hypothetical protein
MYQTKMGNDMSIINTKKDRSVDMERLISIRPSPPIWIGVRNQEVPSESPHQLSDQFIRIYDDPKKHSLLFCQTTDTRLTYEFEDEITLEFWKEDDNVIIYLSRPCICLGKPSHIGVRFHMINCMKLRKDWKSMKSNLTELDRIGEFIKIDNSMH